MVCGVVGSVARTVTGLVGVKPALPGIQFVALSALLKIAPCTVPAYTVRGVEVSRANAVGMNAFELATKRLVVPTMTKLVRTWLKANQLPPLLVLRKTPLARAAYSDL